MFRMSTCGAWFIPIATVFWCNCTSAQITPDATLPNNSIININGKTFNITGGTTAGTNLFHSFKDFSVPNGSEAIFNNTVDIQNIISRVTGGSISNIDGLIRTLGTANLFLINPNGIVFGPNASLNIGGSFIASTANSINFADGTKFSATPSQDLPLLTITAPLGLNMGSNPGPILVQGPGHEFVYDDVQIKYSNRDDPASPPRLLNTSVPGLQVESGKTLALVGGKVSVEGGVLKSPAGRIEIGSVASNQAVSLVSVPEGWKLGYEAVPSFADIQFSGKSFLSTTGVGGGAIAVAGKNINFTSESIVRADTLGDTNGGEISIVGENIAINQSDISSNSFSSGNTGQIKLVANNSIRLENQSGVGTQVLESAKAGDITLQADSIFMGNKSGLSSTTDGTGNAGRIEVKANSFVIENQSTLSNGTGKNSTGNGGEVNLQVAGPLLLLGNGKSGTSIDTYSFGQGDAGKINIRANSLRLENDSGLISRTGLFTTGKAADININVAGPMVANKAGITSDTFRGNGAKINITANSLLMENSGVFSGTYTTGKGGEINFNIAGSFESKSTGISTDVFDGTGDAGKINISANSLLLDSSRISSEVIEKDSTGNAGEININVAGPLVINNAGIYTNNVGTGNAGKLNISANALQMDGSRISIATEGNAIGNAGEINIQVANHMDLRNSSSVDTQTNGTGDAGDLTLNAGTLLVQDGSQVATSALGNGNAGEITLNADTISLSGAKSGVYNTLGSTSAPEISVKTNDGGFPIVNIEPRPQAILPNAQGNSGNINISARLLSVTDGARLTTSTYGKGNAGTININTVNSSVFSGTDTSGSSSSAFSAVQESAVGDGGTIKITTNELAVNNGAQLVASSFGEGNAGTITIQASDKVSVNGDSRNSPPTGVFAQSRTGRGGNIGLEIGNLLLLRSGGLISATSGVEGQDGIDGNIDINTKFVVALPRENSDIIATGFGRSPGSNIRVNAEGIFGTQFRQQLTPESDIVATGIVTLNTPDVDQTLGFVELPIALTDTSELIAGTSCDAIATTDSDTDKSKFTITGRGGLPPSPYEPLTTDVVWLDTRLSAMTTQQQRSQESAAKPPSKSNVVKIVPATGWVFDGKGHVTLISNASNANSLETTPAKCGKQ